MIDFKLNRIKNYEIIDYEIKKNDLNEIIYQMSRSGGFESTNLTKAIDIARKMLDDNRCTRFLSFVGSIISTGARGVIREMIKRKMFDCIVTTCGALDHDIAKTFGKYYAGEFNTDDSHLKNHNIHRLGNVFIPTKNYGPLIENKVQDFLLEYYNKHKDCSGYEIVDYIGSKLDQKSFLYWAHKNKIPVIVPGLLDGAVGNQIWLFYEQHKDFILNLLKDQSKISDLVFDSTKTGALMLGGGISKHHTLWWNQFRNGLDYAVYVTTANEWDGSLSGAEVREAISWNKVNANAKQITIHGEITTLLPFIYASMITS